MQPEAEPDPPEAGGARSGLRLRARTAADAATDWLGKARERRPPIDLAARFYERDREAFASVLGAAIALRLFLFIVSATVLVVGALLTTAGGSGIDRLLTEVNVTGTVAEQMSGAASRDRGAGVAMLLLGAWLTLGNGRKLSYVLAACSAAAWHLGGREARTRVRQALGVSMMLLVLLAASAVLNRLRDATGLGVDTVVWLVTAVVFAVGWFAVTWWLPRSSSDPGALLPGAFLVGAVMAVLQWFMQFYLPDKIARSSEVMGSIGFTVAALGYMFLVGRVMAASLILNAVLFERVGSISEAVFALPVLRGIPGRSRRVARLFDLDRRDATDTDETGGEP